MHAATRHPCSISSRIEGHALTLSSSSTRHWYSSSQPECRLCSLTQVPMLTCRKPVASAAASHRVVLPVPGVPVMRMLGLCLTSDMCDGHTPKPQPQAGLSCVVWSNKFKKTRSAHAQMLASQSKCKWRLADSSSRADKKRVLWVLWGFGPRAPSAPETVSKTNCDDICEREGVAAPPPVGLLGPGTTPT